VAKAVKARLDETRADGCDLGHEQLLRWYSRAQQKFKLIKEASQQSGAARKVALPGEAPGKGMVHHDYFKNLSALFGNDLAIVPPKKLLKGSSGGMTKEQSEKAVRRLKKLLSPSQMAPWGQPPATSSASKKGKSKKAPLETDDALLALSDGEQGPSKRSFKKRPATYEVDSSSEDSLDAIVRGEDDDEEGISVDTDEEECATVLRDEGVEVDTHPVVRVQEELEELDAVRSAARKRQSLDRGNSQDRQRMHQINAAYNSFQKACDAVKDSHLDSKSTVTQLAEFDANEAMFAKGYITAEYHAKMKEEIQRKYAPPHFVATKPSKAKKAPAQNSTV
jgi:hypothetical protein